MDNQPIIKPQAIPPGHQTYPAIALTMDSGRMGHRSVSVISTGPDSETRQALPPVNDVNQEQYTDAELKFAKDSMPRKLLNRRSALLKSNIFSKKQNRRALRNENHLEKDSSPKMPVYYHQFHISGESATEQNKLPDSLNSGKSSYSQPESNTHTAESEENSFTVAVYRGLREIYSAEELKWFSEAVSKLPESSLNDGLKS